MERLGVCGTFRWKSSYPIGRQWQRRIGRRSRPAVGAVVRLAPLLRSFAARVAPVFRS